jgi:hypothetical protein
MVNSPHFCSGGNQIVRGLPSAPELTLSPFLWYDFTDGGTVFNDTSGSNHARQGDQIKLILDKGSQGHNLLDSGGSLTYDLDAINGLSVALSTAITAMDNNFGFAPAGTGWTFACTAKHDGASTQQKVFSWETNRQIQQDEVGSGNWEASSNSGPTVVDTAAPVVDGEWIGVYMKNDNSLNFDTRASGQAQVDSATPAFFNPGAFETFQIGVFDGQIGEVMVFDTFLDATDSQTLLDYFDAKYGTLPRTA